MRNYFRPRLDIKEKEWPSIVDIARQLSPAVTLKLLQDKGENVPIDYFVNRDLSVRRLKSLYKSSSDKYKNLQGQWDKLNTAYNDLLAIEDGRKPTKIKISKKAHSRKEATALLQWSDWHIGEVVTKAKTNGLNEYNLNIAKVRVTNLVNNTIALIKKERQHSIIDNVVIHLGGDFIGGWIHSELEQTNSMSPIEETIEAENLIIGAIDALQKALGFKDVKIICNRGNHGRTTRKMQFANELETSYETMIYAGLIKHYKNTYEVDVIIPAGDIGYCKIYDYTIRYIHGHQIRYAGGVGGISIPLNKKIAKWDKTKRADLTILGHFHMLQYPTPRSVINGSLKGYDNFAQSIAAEYTPAQQGFQLISPTRFLVMKTPIFVD